MDYNSKCGKCYGIFRETSKGVQRKHLAYAKKIICFWINFA